jgi:hypothetical protein
VSGRSLRADRIGAEVGMIPMPGRKSLVAYNGYDSGLGNRVRVVLGARSLARLENRDFFYVWPTGKLFGPKMSDLWHFSGHRISRATSRLLARRWPYVDEKLDWIDDAKRREWLWQIRTGSPLQLPAEAASWTEEFRGLRPVAAIADRVTAFYDENLRGRTTVGVQIRAHAVSHAKTREASPVEWYLTRMKEIRDAVPDVHFFISCDVPDVTARVLAELPNSVAIVEKGGYNTVEGVRSAVCDLYLLASTQYLVGPHWSSFIHLAEYLSNDLLVLETSVTGPPTEFALLPPVADPLQPYRRSV